MVGRSVSESVIQCSNQPATPSIREQPPNHTLPSPFPHLSQTTIKPAPEILAAGWMSTEVT